MKATKIVCTLGPASSDKSVIKGMLAGGMNVARINCSHGTHQEHAEKIQTFREACQEMDLPPTVLLDTRGPEIRLGVFEGDKVELQTGQTFTLSCGPEITGSSEASWITYSRLADQVKAGTTILLDDGKLKLKVNSVQGADILCIVEEGGELSSRKGVNVPEIHLDMDYLSEQDKADLAFGIRQDVDYVAASFVRTPEDVKDLRSFLDSEGGQEIRIISKIENPEGIRYFDAILQESDGIMIARGDMGVEVDFATLPGIQKRFIEKCNRIGKPVITATQMLESMINESTPTRAEITDVANAVFDGSSAVMLSGESAAGKYPVQAVEAMTRILEQAEKDMVSSLRRRSPEELYSRTVTPGEADVSTAIGHAACQAARDVGAKALIAITQSGYTARVMARFHPLQPIVAATPSEGAGRKMALIRGVYPVITKSETDFDLLLARAMKAAGTLGFMEKGDRVVVSAGLPLNISGNTNLIRVEVYRE